MKLLKTTTVNIALTAGMLLQVGRAWAADPVKIPDSVPAGPSVTELAIGAIGALVWVAGIACVITIIVGGIMYTTSAGNESRLKTAKDAILYAVIGLIITLCAYAIVNFVLGIF